MLLHSSSCTEQQEAIWYLSELLHVKIALSKNKNNSKHEDTHMDALTRAVRVNHILTSYIMAAVQYRACTVIRECELYHCVRDYNSMAAVQYRACTVIRECELYHCVHDYNIMCVCFRFSFQLLTAPTWCSTGVWWSMRTSRRRIR